MSKKLLAHFSLLGTLLAIGLAATPEAQAAPISWTISGGTFTGGGTFSGTFDFDPGNNAFGAINISVTGGSFTDFTYSDAAGASGGLGGTIAGHKILTFSASGNNRELFFALNPDLTTVGGSSPIFISSGNSAELIINPFNTRNISGGTVSGIASTAPVPEPSTLALFSAGVLTVIGLRRRSLRSR